MGITLQTISMLLEAFLNYLREHSFQALIDLVVIAGVVVYFIRKRYSGDRWL